MSDLTHAPIDLEIAAPAAAASPVWSLPTRIAFRFTFCYLLIYALCCGNATIWQVIPFHIGEFIERALSWPFNLGAQWIAQHLLHLTGVGSKLHGGGSGDRMLNWIAVGIMLAVALLAAVIWSARAESSRRSLAYPRLFRWFRFILRLTLGVAMLNYGFVKVFPLQMGPPLLAVLNEPLGSTSPMTMLWTLIGLNPVYEAICGATEVIAGLLILFRRTALLGTLLTVFVTTNIVLYNFCFDVPVKIYAAHLLLMSLALVVPDLPALFSFFLRNTPSIPVTPWSPFPTAPPATARGRWINETTITAAVLLIVVAINVTQLAQAYLGQRNSAAHPSPFTGQWHVDSALLHGQPKPFLTNDEYPLTDIYLEPTGRAEFRGADHALYRGGFSLDTTKHTASLRTLGPPNTYTFQQPDPAHLILTPTGKDANTIATLTLTRVPLPAGYPLLQRGFHFVNEWGLER